MFWATDRSKAPAASGKITASARIPVMAWTARIDFSVVMVRKVAGVQMEKITMNAAHRISPVYRLSPIRPSSPASCPGSRREPGPDGRSVSSVPVTTLGPVTRLPPFRPAVP